MRLPPLSGKVTPGVWKVRGPELGPIKSLSMVLENDYNSLKLQRVEVTNKAR